MKYDLTKPRTSLNTGRKPSTTNLKTAVQTLAEMGLNPFYEIARLAVRAEKEKDLVTASTNWRFLSEYVDAKRKAIDPLEQKALAKQVGTMEDLQKLKAAIMAGTMALIPDDSIIEPEAFTEAEEVFTSSEFM